MRAKPWAFVPKLLHPHYWLQRDILQIKHFQYRFFNNIILTDDTIPRVKIFTQFLLKFLRFNYQLIWEQKDQQAYVNFPQILTHIELLPYIIKNENKHLHYRDLTSLNVTHFEQINLDHNFVLEHSETSENRPFITPDTCHETIPEEQTFSVEPAYTRQQSEQSEQESPEQEALVNLFQNPDSPQEQPSYPPSSQFSDIQQPNPSETNTIHNTSEFSQETVQNTRSFTITDDSNLIMIPTHNITQTELTNQNQNNTSNTNPDNTSILSTSNTNITQSSQTQILSPRNYNPPSVPPQFSTQINTHDSSQQSSSNTPYIGQNNNTVHFQTPTPPLSSEIHTSTYTPAQTNSIQTTQTTLNINTIHSNPSTNYTTARHLSRPPLQTILTNPLSYSLTSTNPSNTQQSQINYNTTNQLNTLSSLPNIHPIQLLLHYKLLNFIYQILLQQQLELTLTFIVIQLFLYLIFPIIPHTIQHLHLLCLITLCHTQHILILLLLYQNPLNLLMDSTTTIHLKSIYNILRHVLHFP